MGQFNRVLLAVWRANVDVQPILNLASLIDYLNKYITKAEDLSDKFNEIFKESENYYDHKVFLKLI